MSPFGSLLRYYRNERGIPLKTLAAEIGVSEKILSAIEVRRRRPLDEKNIERICKFLDLTEEESTALNEAAQLSHTYVRIPTGASPLEYRLVHRFIQSLGHLSDTQIAVIYRTLDQRVGLREGGDMT